jgi:SAM-dependent methyltransferase
MRLEPVLERTIACQEQDFDHESIIGERFVRTHPSFGQASFPVLGVVSDAGTTRGVGASITARTRKWAMESKTVRRWRERRYQRFVELCRVEPHERILDVGAGSGAALERFNSTNEIVALDLNPIDSEWIRSPNVTVQVGDATQMPFGDKEFPLAFSSSVIEHIPKSLQGKFAGEIRRVADRYYVQTPNRYFPIEPHYQMPLFHFLPVRLQRALNKRFTMGWQEKGSWEEITLLSARDLRGLFPDGEIHRERVFGLTKSLMVVRR